MPKIFRFFSIFFYFTLISFLFADSLFAGSTKMVMMNPIRAIFTDRQRSLNLKLINTSEEQLTYGVSIVTLLKGTDGKLMPVKEETEKQKMVREMIRFSPRRATIAPKTRQIIKLMVRKPKDLPPGEYLTYIQYTPLKQESDVTSDNNISTFQENSFNIDVLVTSRYPVIIQHGHPPAVVTPTSLKITQSNNADSGISAEVDFSREGALSAFGDIFLTHIPKQGKDKRIAVAQGVPFYLTNSERKVTIALRDISQEELSSGSIRVDFHPNRGVVERRRQSNINKTSKEFPLQ